MSKEAVKNHWENVYQSKPPDQVSWFQPHLEKSLELIRESGIDKSARIIDVGGGASTLPDDLLRQGYGHLTVLDISAEALRQSQKRLGKKAAAVQWLEADILKADLPKNNFDLWHDRAVFHFLTEPEDKRVYFELLKRSLKPDGFLIIAAFGLEGPSKCSGLEVSRYSAETLSKECGSDFSLLHALSENHQTPFNKTQVFLYCLFKRAAQ